MKKQIIHQLAILFLVSASSFSQKNWVETWETSTNFYEIQDSFNAYWEGKDISARGNGYKVFKRWEYMMEPRVYPSGDLNTVGATWQNYLDYLEENPSESNNRSCSAPSWEAMGPFGNPSGLAENNLPRKAGRLNFITFHPTIPTTFFVGSATGGLWKTTDNGVTWNILNEELFVNGCTDLAIDPTNPNIMYLATGDGYLFSIPSGSMGIMKSTDGGLTWGQCNLNFNVSAQVKVRRIIINPNNPLIVLAATSQGVYRTDDGGLTAWDTINNFSTYDLEFKPGDPSVVYSGGYNIKKSIDGGLNFGPPISAGIPTAGSWRMNIAVTPANPNYVYVVSCNSDYNLQGVYRSTNSAVSFIPTVTTPNYLGGSDCTNPTFVSASQGFYDLGLAVSPIDANEVVIGGVNSFISTNGGFNFVNLSCAYPASVNPSFMHADQHDYDYTPAGVLYGVNDGGVNYFDGTGWVDITGSMNIAAMYKIGLSSLSPNLWITGHQDNGVNVYNDGVYDAGLSSDGMDCFIDRTNDQVMYGSKQFGQFHKSTDGGQTWLPCAFGMVTPGGFVTPWKQDPQIATTLYAGRAQMYRSTNSAGNWIATPGVMSGVDPTEFVTEFAIAPSNNQKIYAIHESTGIFVTNDAGATNWVLSNGSIALWAGALTFLTVHPTDPQTAWVTQSGFTNGYKVWKTINGGTTWQNISYDLPNIPANCSVYETGCSGGRLYVGMDVGVYYLDNGSTSWTLYSDGLPNTKVNDLEISPANPTKLRAATYGRGVYEIDVVPCAAPPVTNYDLSGDPCTVPSVYTTFDNSTNSPCIWQWSVVPATGVTISDASAENPDITFTIPGTYAVSSMATNDFGDGNINTQNVTIGNPVVAVVSSSDSICENESVIITASGANTYSWMPGSLSGTVINPTLTSDITYTVTGTATNGCIDDTTILIIVVDCIGVGLDPENKNQLVISVFPNPTFDELTIRIVATESTNFNLELRDVSGKIVYVTSAQFSSKENLHTLDVSYLSKGVYFLNLISEEGNNYSIKIIKD